MFVIVIIRGTLKQILDVHSLNLNIAGGIFDECESTDIGMLEAFQWIDLA